MNEDFENNNANKYKTVVGQEKHKDGEAVDYTGIEYIISELEGVIKDQDSKYVDNLTKNVGKRKEMHGATNRQQLSVLNVDSSVGNNSENNSVNDKTNENEATGGAKERKKRKKVSRACVYCRRSHMTCDIGRPCQRCIKRKIGHLCRDEGTQNQGKKVKEEPIYKENMAVVPMQLQKELKYYTLIPNTTIPSQTKAHTPGELNTSFQMANMEGANIRIPLLSNADMENVKLDPRNDILQESELFATSKGKDVAKMHSVRASNLKGIKPKVSSNLNVSSSENIREFSLTGTSLGGQGGDSVQAIIDIFKELTNKPALKTTETTQSTLGEIIGKHSSLFEGIGNSLKKKKKAYLSPSVSFGADEDVINRARRGADPASYPKRAKAVYLSPIPTVDNIPKSVEELYNEVYRCNSSDQERLLEKVKEKSTLNKEVLSRLEGYFLKCLDEYEGIPESKLRQELVYKFSRGLLKPYSQMLGYIKLHRYIEHWVSLDLLKRLISTFGVFKQKSREVAKLLTDYDMLINEVVFEKTVMEYAHVFQTFGIPSCLWRRTGEIYRANQQFADLVGLPLEYFREGRVCIYELFTEKSFVTYAEKYVAVAFDASKQSVLTSCELSVSPVIKSMIENDKLAGLWSSKSELNLHPPVLDNQADSHYTSSPGSRSQHQQYQQYEKDQLFRINDLQDNNGSFSSSPFSAPSPMSATTNTTFSPSVTSNPNINITYNSGGFNGQSSTSLIKSSNLRSMIFTSKNTTKIAKNKDIVSNSSPVLLPPTTTATSPISSNTVPHSQPDLILQPAVNHNNIVANGSTNFTSKNPVSELALEPNRSATNENNSSQPILSTYYSSSFSSPSSNSSQQLLLSTHSGVRPLTSAATATATATAAPAETAPKLTTNLPKQKPLRCCFSFTVRRDKNQLPIAIIGNFMPINT
ncbi:Regulator of drug sensitivity 2 [Zancudomyces culisetae]|uniref:Regulator of drug sensitivity 2 n=1 Tax=Zancudomyces culisetae TaxID=1213189 RepID=A0A1R1PX88_ZANCU|nr:Regulator of drug sensitivity 2 [Zancudomyces culisetae]|eukprot:OMH85605.1 Regulator of drug sensitivity 2 [Zancudomyces culisetae]